MTEQEQSSPQESRTQQLLNKLNEDFGPNDGESFGMMGVLRDEERDIQRPAETTRESGREDVPHQEERDSATREPKSEPKEDPAFSALNSSLQDLRRTVAAGNDRQAHLERELLQARQQAAAQQQQEQYDPSQLVNYGELVNAKNQLTSQVQQLATTQHQIAMRQEYERARNAYERQSTKYEDFGKQMPIEQFNNIWSQTAKNDPRNTVNIDWNTYLDASYQATQGPRVNKMTKEIADLKKELEELRSTKRSNSTHNLVPRSTITSPGFSSSDSSSSGFMSKVERLPTFRNPKRGGGSMTEFGRDLSKLLSTGA